MLAEASKHTCCILYMFLHVCVADITFITHQSICVVLTANAIKSKWKMTELQQLFSVRSFIL